MNGRARKPEESLMSPYKRNHRSNQSCRSWDGHSPADQASLMEDGPNRRCQVPVIKGNSLLLPPAICARRNASLMTIQWLPQSWIFISNNGSWRRSWDGWGLADVSMKQRRLRYEMDPWMLSKMSVPLSLAYVPLDDFVDLNGNRTALWGVLVIALREKRVAWSNSVAGVGFHPSSSLLCRPHLLTSSVVGCWEAALLQRGKNGRRSMPYVPEVSWFGFFITSGHCSKRLSFVSRYNPWYRAAPEKSSTGLM